MKALLALLFLTLTASAQYARLPGVGSLIPSLSDSFAAMPDARWNGLLRGMPTAISTTPDGLLFQTMEPEQDAWPLAEDFGMSFASAFRVLTIAEQPSIVLNVWVPPFAEYPVGGAGGSEEPHYFGFRTSARDVNGYNLWNGIFAGRTFDAAKVPSWNVRQVSSYQGKPITVSGWWTLGLCWTAQGRARYFAAPGKVILTEADLLMEGIEGHVFATIDGHFLCIRAENSQTSGLTTPWRISNLRTYRVSNARPSRPPEPRGAQPPL